MIKPQFIFHTYIGSFIMNICSFRRRERRRAFNIPKSKLFKTMVNFDGQEYWQVVQRLARKVHGQIDAGMSMRAALYRSVSECIGDLWNRDVSLRVCELSEREPEIEMVNEIVAEDATDTHADYEVFIRAMAFSVLEQDVRDAVENTVSVERNAVNAQSDRSTSSSRPTRSARSSQPTRPDRHELGE